ncbi:hypothetical protein EC973_008500 [Apophysomyces ossiformis]|uniref:SURP motif domain-containing protein n=1 Tax=Apophysomyces ossiformis TaxID=679940 RepID=A0A8H7BQI9_9FUNG|nr:hypothetical protein EC973_008500 [Apophysomyces ossiformis]
MSAPSHSRKRSRQDAKQEEEFLVFGYEARIFNDSALAEKIDQGDYLIPWRSDPASKLRIDRYDVRHLLEELPSSPTTNERIQSDQQCDEERYADLDSEEETLFSMSDDERDTYLEEKRKRRKMEQENKLFHYDYRNGTGNNITPIQADLAAKYKAPATMAMPTTEEQAKIIDETAKAVVAAVHPNLLEIRIQARQGNNPMYRFLNKSDELYPFYKHILWLSQSGLAAYGSDSSDNEDDEKETARPPSHIEEVIEKTAKFVAKSGQELENRIKERNAHDPKFSFLQPGNMYYTYYKTQVESFQSRST